MKELFDRHQDKLTDAEDRRLWQALTDARKQSVWSRWRIPSAVIATGAVAALALVVMQNVGESPVGDRLAKRYADDSKPVGTMSDGNRQEAALEEKARQDKQVGTDAEELAGKNDEAGAAANLKKRKLELQPEGQEFVKTGPEKDAQGPPAEETTIATQSEMSDALAPLTMSDQSGDKRSNEGTKEQLQARGGRESETDYRIDGQPVDDKLQDVQTWFGIEGQPPARDALAGTPSPVAGNAPSAEERGKVVSTMDQVIVESKPSASAMTSSETGVVGRALPIPPGKKPQPGQWEQYGDQDASNSVGGSASVNGQDFDAMFFEHYGVNPFMDPREDRFATFAVDVDNASYTLARSYLNRGVLPPKDAIRVEEFVNALDHGYAAPGASNVASREPVSEHGTFAIHLDAAPSPFGKGLQLLRVGLKGREIDAADRKPAVLTFVVDVSGSMEREDRLGLVKQSLHLLLDRLRGTDQVALVVYGSDARVVLEATSLRDLARIESAIDALIPEGSTNAEAGLRAGYAIASRSFQASYINRVILCSDGVANVGETGAEGILETIRKEAEGGIELTTVGFGMGNYNDVLMEKLANQGDGSYFYVDDIEEARRLFVENMTGTLQTIAREVKIQVEFDPQRVRRYRLLGYENRDVADQDFRNDTVDAGEVGAGHEVTALFEMSLEGTAPAGELATVRIRYQDPQTGKVTEESRAVRVEDLAARSENLDPTFQMDAAVAEFAEILRRSYWAKDGDLEKLLAFARGASERMDRPAEVVELVRMIEVTSQLWPSDETREYDVKPAWEPEGWR